MNTSKLRLKCAGCFDLSKGNAITKNNKTITHVCMASVCVDIYL